MKDEFFKQRAKRVRDIASLADPFTKKRLLALAERYDAAKPSPRRTAIPALSISGEQQAVSNDGGSDSG
jgi:hypothetical protein